MMPHLTKPSFKKITGSALLLSLSVLASTSIQADELNQTKPTEADSAIVKQNSAEQPTESSQPTFKTDPSPEGEQIPVENSLPSQGQDQNQSPTALHLTDFDRDSQVSQSQDGEVYQPQVQAPSVATSPAVLEKNQTKDLSTFKKQGDLPHQLTSSQMLDGAVLIETGNLQDGSKEGVPFKIASWEQNGKYALRLGYYSQDSGLSDDKLIKEARGKGTPLLSSAGWSNYGYLDNPWDQKHSKAEGRDGVLYSDGENHFKSTTIRETGQEIYQIFDYTGLKGWNTVSFGTLYKDGKVDTNWQAGDSDAKNARSILVLTKSGLVKIIQTYGHTNYSTGLNHKEVYQLLDKIGYNNIELAYALDGGGSTRMYTKTDDGQEEVSGAKVDQRISRIFFYLAPKNSGDLDDDQGYTNPDMAKANQSVSITANQFFAAKAAGQDYVPGTSYKVHGQAAKGNTPAPQGEQGNPGAEKAGQEASSKSNQGPDQTSPSPSADPQVNQAGLGSSVSSRQINKSAGGPQSQAQQQAFQAKQGQERLPKTGDKGRLAMMAGLGLGMVAIAGLTYLAKRKKF